MRDRRPRLAEQGWVKPEPPSVKTGKKVAVVGSGPAGMACAQQLARVGHDVHVYEKRQGRRLAPLRHPDFKMEKHHVDRRAAQMEAEGVTFYGAHVGVNVPAERSSPSTTLVLTGGAEEGRDLPIPGRELKGIHFAMEFLPQQNRRSERRAARGRRADPRRRQARRGHRRRRHRLRLHRYLDRQGALSVTNFEIMPRPPLAENKLMTWPDWPLKLRTSSSHEEGVARDFAVLTRNSPARTAR